VTHICKIDEIFERLRFGPFKGRKRKAGEFLNGKAGGETPETRYRD
jgi:hypothetical protein